MKIKNKIYTLLSVFTLVGLTHSLTLKDLNAALTPPSSYDYSYRSRNVSGNTLFYNEADEIVWYTRTGASFPYDFSSTGTYGPTGMEITMRFDKSTILWTEGTGLFAGKYRPHTSYSYIGSDNSVGTISSKVDLTFDNQTNKDYRLYLDVSSTSANSNYQYIIDSMTQASSSINSTSMNSFLIPAYRNVRIFANSSSSARYFDAWYLEDLGQSPSYDFGYYDGYDQGDIDGYADGLGNNPNVLLNGFQAMVGILVNFMLMIVNLEVFGVSLINVFSILALFVGIVWILKIIRG
jgi:hypothetical protein